jgi:hypothetical protein
MDIDDVCNPSHAFSHVCACLQSAEREYCTAVDVLAVRLLESAEWQSQGAQVCVCVCV